MRLKSIAGLFARAGESFIADEAPRMGAALAFYAIISLTPLLVVVVGVAGQI